MLLEQNLSHTHIIEENLQLTRSAAGSQDTKDIYTKAVRVSQMGSC